MRWWCNPDTASSVGIGALLGETSRSERTNKLSPFSIALSADANKLLSAFLSDSSSIASESDTENVIGSELTWNPLSLTALIYAS